MRYRALSATGDYTFGQSQANFLIDTPATVQQSLLTRLNLWTGQWFLNKTAGTEWLPGVLGKNTQSLYDQIIRARILSTSGVTAITKYASTLLPDRHLQIDADVDTKFGPTTISTVIG